MMNSSPDSSEIKSWLEWAGERLLSMRIQGAYPSSYRSFWPDYANNPNTAYGYSKTPVRPGIPSSKEISLMDEVFDLILLVSIPTRRQILHARSLIRPINGRHMYSWTRIAEIVHSDQRSVKYQYKIGLDTIVEKIPDTRVVFFRTNFSSGPSISS